MIGFIFFFNFSLFFCLLSEKGNFLVSRRFLGGQRDRGTKIGPIIALYYNIYIYYLDALFSIIIRCNTHIFDFLNLDCPFRF